MVRSVKIWEMFISAHLFGNVMSTCVSSFDLFLLATTHQIYMYVHSTRVCRGMNLICVCVAAKADETHCRCTAEGGAVFGFLVVDLEAKHTYIGLIRCVFSSGVLHICLGRGRVYKLGGGLLLFMFT